MTSSENFLTESAVEDAALEWLKTLGWQVVRGCDIVPHTEGGQRRGYDEVVLESRLCDALDQLNSSYLSKP